MASRPRFTSKILKQLLSTSQGKSYTVAAITILLVLILFVVGIFPAVSSILFQVTENDSRRTALETIEEKRQIMRKLIGEEAEKKAVSLALETYMPDEIDQKYTLAKIAEIATEAEGNLIGVGFTRLDLAKNLQQVYNITSPLLDGYIVQISYEGSSASLEEFIEIMESKKRLFNIIDMSIFKQELEESITNQPFRMEMQAEIYYWNLNRPAELEAQGGVPVSSPVTETAL